MLKPNLDERIQLGMKAIAVFPAKRDVELIDEPEPQIATPSDVKLRMLEVGVCGTDREICSFEYGTPPPGSEHLVIGHESIGEVVEIGSAVSRVKVGDLVIPMVRRPCPHAYCRACREGRQDFCFTGDFSERGIKERHGFMTELVVDDEQYMNIVPSSLRDVAILVEPLTIAEKGISEIWQVQQRLPWLAARDGEPDGTGHNAVVLGAGPVGLLGAMALVTRGFTTYVYSREATPNPKADLVTSIGATYVSASTDTLDDLVMRVGNIDVVYEASGASKASFDLMKGLGTNGIFVFTGVPGRKGPMEIDTDSIMRNLVLRNQVVFGTVNANRPAFEAAIADLEVFRRRFPTALSALITGRFAMDDYRSLLLGNATGIKNVIAIG